MSRDHTLRVRLDSADAMALRLLAARGDETMSAVARRAIRYHLAAQTETTQVSGVRISGPARLFKDGDDA